MITILILIAIGYLTLYFVSHPVKSLRAIGITLLYLTVGIATSASVLFALWILIT